MFKDKLLTVSVTTLLLGAAYFMGTRHSIVHADSSPVYELRTYHCYPGKLDALLARFRDHTPKLFESHGIDKVAYWVPTDEPHKSNTLIYIISHESRQKAEENWKSFQADPEWKKVREASEANGKIVEKVDREFMVSTDFSPMK